MRGRLPKAVLWDMDDGEGATGSVPVRDFFAQRPNAPRMLTVSVGGNDMAFRETIQACVMGSCIAQEDMDRYNHNISLTRARLDALCSLLRGRFPYTDIVAMGYPSPVGTKSAGINQSGTCLLINTDEAEHIMRATTELNAAVDSAARAHGVRHGFGPRVQAEFRTHGACDTGVWIHGLVQMSHPLDLGGNSFHQNQGGHFHYGSVMNSVIGDRIAAY